MKIEFWGLSDVAIIAVRRLDKRTAKQTAKAIAQQHADASRQNVQYTINGKYFTVSPADGLIRSGEGLFDMANAGQATTDILSNAR